MTTKLAMPLTEALYARLHRFSQDETNRRRGGGTLILRVPTTAHAAGLDNPIEEHALERERAHIRSMTPGQMTVMGEWFFVLTHVDLTSDDSFITLTFSMKAL
jgi:hypothetical protein